MGCCNGSNDCEDKLELKGPAEFLTDQEYHDYLVAEYTTSLDRYSKRLAYGLETYSQSSMSCLRVKLQLLRDKLNIPFEILPQDLTVKPNITLTYATETMVCLDDDLGTYRHRDLRTTVDTGLSAPYDIVSDIMSGITEAQLTALSDADYVNRVEDTKDVVYQSFINGMSLLDSNITEVTTNAPQGVDFGACPVTPPESGTLSLQWASSSNGNLTLISTSNTSQFSLQVPGKDPFIWDTSVGTSLNLNPTDLGILTSPDYNVVQPVTITEVGAFSKLAHIETITTSGQMNVFFSMDLIDLLPFNGLVTLQSNNNSSSMSNKENFFGDIANIPPTVKYVNITGAYTGDVANLPASVERAYFKSNAFGLNPPSITGNLSAFKEGLTDLHLYKDHAITGSTADLPSTLQEFVSYDFLNPIHVDLSLLPPVMHTLEFKAINFSNPGLKVTGNIENLPSTMDTISIPYGVVSGDSMVTGNASLMPGGMTELDIRNVPNTISGDLAVLPPLRYLYVYGNNTLTGDIQNAYASITTWEVGGDNTIYGSLAGKTFTGSATLKIKGANTITGDVAQFSSSIRNLVIDGNNTISGDLAKISCVNSTTIEIRGLNTISAYTLPSSFTTSSTFSIVVEGQNTLPTADVDNLITDIDTKYTGGNSSLSIRVQGLSQPRSAATDAVVTSITSAGGTVITNP